jgi:hypothetical protein
VLGDELEYSVLNETNDMVRLMAIKNQRLHFEINLSIQYFIGDFVYMNL